MEEFCKNKPEQLELAQIRDHWKKEVEFYSRLYDENIITEQSLQYYNVMYCYGFRKLVDHSYAILHKAQCNYGKAERAYNKNLDKLLSEHCCDYVSNRKRQRKEYVPYNNDLHVVFTS